MPTPCQKPPHEVQRGRRRPRADRVAVARDLQLERRPRPRATTRAGRRARPASPACRRPARRCPVTETPTSAPSRSRTPAAIAAAASAETAPCSASSARGTPSSRLLDRVRVGDDAAEHDVARAGDRREPRRDEPARAGLGGRERPARAPGTASSTSSSTGRPSRAKTYGSSASTSAASTRPRALLGARLGDEVDADLEVVRADRRHEPVPLAARLLEARARPPTRSRRRRASTRSSAAGTRASSRRIGSDSSARATAAAAPPAGPGSAIATRPPSSSSTPGAVPASPSDSAPAGSVACFTMPGWKSAYGRLNRFEIAPRDALDLRPQRLVQHRARGR